MGTDADTGFRQPRVGRRQRRPLPAYRRWLRRQRHAVRTQEAELPIRVGDHLKPLFVHRAVVESAAENEIPELCLPTVSPMHDVMGVAVAGFAAGELALAAIAVQQGAAQGGRDRARPATDVEHLAIDAVAQRDEGGIAGDPARRLPAQVQTTCLVNDRLTGVEVRWRRRTRAGAVVRPGRFRRNVRRGSGRLLDRGRRDSDRLRGRLTGRARFRGNCARQSLEWGKVM